MILRYKVMEWDGYAWKETPPTNRGVTDVQTSELHIGILISRSGDYIYDVSLKKLPYQRRTELYRFNDGKNKITIYDHNAVLSPQEAGEIACWFRDNEILITRYSLGD